VPGRDKNAYKILIKKASGYLGRPRRIILKCILKK
jgi:hypothetical protein